MGVSNKINRRNVLKAGLGGAAGLATASLGLLARPKPGWAQERAPGRSGASAAAGGAAGGAATGPGGAAPVAAEALSPTLTLISGVPGNVLALATGQGTVLVDSGAASTTTALREKLNGARVTTLINTHYHADQTGGNAVFGEAGATIHAHEVTRQWLSSDYYVPAEDRWIEALPKSARPTKTFRLKDTLNVGSERIELGYLLEAHTRGDLYVYFRDANVLAVGDVASPLRDPAHDWYAGGWLGGRVDAMDDLLELANPRTRIVPAYGPVMTRAQLQAERDMMSHLYDRTSKLVNQGRSAEDLLEAGVLDEVDRKFADPERFLYDVAKGLWAHYTNFGGNVV